MQARGEFARRYREKLEKIMQVEAAEEVTPFKVNIRGYINVHNRMILERMFHQLEDIMNEGDYRKTGAIQSIFDVLAPKKEEE